MNLLLDDFISTTSGKISLKELLTSDIDYELQYFFDEIQLSALQLLSSLTTVVLKPTMDELKIYLECGITSKQYDEAVAKVNTALFDERQFMQSKSTDDRKYFDAPITKMISGIECGDSGNASGLFSETSNADVVCPDCVPLLNYNLHMNIKAESFGPAGGSTGIRGGGSISTLIAAKNLKQTVLANTMTTDFFSRYKGNSTTNKSLMWEEPPTGDIYYAHKIGLERGLFATAYHISFDRLNEPCVCDICGNQAQQSIKEFSRLKYTGTYGSTKTGRDSGAGWWPHPYTPTTKKNDGVYPLCARGEKWQSWENLTAYVIGRESAKALLEPAPIVAQFKEMDGGANLLVGGNIADQGSVVGRVYDLYSMPEHWDEKMERVTKVIDAGLLVKDGLSKAISKIFGVGYDKNLVAGIKDKAIYQYISNAQIIVQRLLVDAGRTDLAQLRDRALLQLKAEALSIYRSLITKYQDDLPLFKALVKGEKSLLSIGKIKN
ncbi:MAG: hypothetical protein COB22_08745 [Cycloclasticus sp.]|nr:MAG: hypothetical protein COB22_08745 [Cycloclasticus sp.]